MKAAKKKSAPRPRSGFVTEEQRNTDRLTLRLDPEAMTRLRAFAFEHGWTVSQTVAEALGALERELATEHKENVPARTR